ncbi:hypothetical protein G9A89_000492, partial [Geosiphon pyriformis]
MSGTPVAPCIRLRTICSPVNHASHILPSFNFPGEVVLIWVSWVSFPTLGCLCTPGQVLASSCTTSGFYKSEEIHFWSLCEKLPHALRVAFEEFIILQQNPPIVRLQPGDQFSMVRECFFWINTIADGLANDPLVGRINVGWEDPEQNNFPPIHTADDSMHHCKFNRQSSIECLIVAALGPSPDVYSGTTISSLLEDAALQTNKNGTIHPEQGI